MPWISLVTRKQSRYNLCGFHLSPKPRISFKKALHRASYLPLQSCTHNSSDGPAYEHRGFLLFSILSKWLSALQSLSAPTRNAWWLTTSNLNAQLLVTRTELGSAFPTYRTSSQLTSWAFQNLNGGFLLSPTQTRYTKAVTSSALGRNQNKACVEQLQQKRLGNFPFFKQRISLDGAQDTAVHGRKLLLLVSRG